MSDAYLVALRVERAARVERGLDTEAVDAEICRLAGPPVVETAAFAAPENAAIKRGPGRPRKDA